MPLIDYSFLNKILPQPKFRKSFRNLRKSYLLKIRIAVSFFYFGMGFCFASLASRIPDIKTMLSLSDGSLGNFLFAIPLGQLTALPFSGKIVARYGSRNVIIICLLLYALALANIGLATEKWQLALALFLFGMAGNFSNIAVNTQGVYAEDLYGKPIMGSFHGFWSLAGFFGASVGSLMVFLKFDPFSHFLFSLGFVAFIVLFNYKLLIQVKKPKKPDVIPVKKKWFTLPDQTLIWLGIIGFCCGLSEGAMFDWSGVYFKDIVKVPEDLVPYGFISFMTTMSTGRFLSDYLVKKFGRRLVLQVSGCCISVGLLSAVALPYLVTCMISFMVVGIGVATVIPSVYSLAGKNGKVPPAEALTTVSSICFLGFFLGPTIIGHIAEAFTLRYSFGFIGIFGFVITILVTKLKLIAD